MAKCISCFKEVDNCISFNCPRCKEKIQRCSKCRTLSIEYKCKCGFIGP